MSNIDYSKAEKEVEKAVQHERVKNLIEGKPITSSNAIRYFALEEDTPRPPPPDNVEKLLCETAAAEEDELLQEEAQTEASEEEEETEEEFEILEKIPESDTLKKARKQSTRLPKRKPIPGKTLPLAEKFLEKSALLFILRQHILWLKRLHFDDRYEKLGTTKEEIFAFRRSRRLSDVDLKRIKELNVRAEKLKKELLEEEEITTVEEEIEREKQRHKTKRFNTRETWIPL
jgi:hypothetical protein